MGAVSEFVIKIISENIMIHEYAVILFGDFQGSKVRKGRRQGWGDSFKDLNIQTFTQSSFLVKKKKKLSEKN